MDWNTLIVAVAIIVLVVIAKFSASRRNYRKHLIDFFLNKLQTTRDLDEFDKTVKELTNQGADFPDNLDELRQRVIDGVTGPQRILVRDLPHNA